MNFLNKILKTIKLLPLAIVLILSSQVRAQTWITVEDTVFANYLCTNHNLVMNPGCTAFDKQLVEDTVDGIIDLAGTGLHSLNEINHFIRIDTLYLSNNNLDTLPDITLFSVDLFDLSYNQLTHFPSILGKWQNESDAHTIKFNNNHVVDFPNIFSARATLQYLYANENQLENLLPLDSFLILEYVNVANNNLTFEDLLAWADYPGFDSIFTVFPQRNIPTVDSMFVMAGQELLIDIDVDDAIGTNTYHWYQNGVEIATTNSNALLNMNVLPSHEGYYYVTVENPHSNLNGNFIYTDSIWVEVIPDMSGLNFTIDNQCNGAYIMLNASQLASFGTEFTYSITDSSTNLTYNQIGNDFADVYKGTYDLNVFRNGSYAITITDWVTIQEASNCDRVITPNGDGVQDIYYFDFTGSASIYSKSGVEVKQLQLPGPWDATDVSGQLVEPGIYFVRTSSGKFFDLTVIR